MDWRISGQDQPFLFDFVNDGQFVTPDSFSAFLTVRDNSGAIIAGDDHVQQFGVIGNQVRFTILAAANALGAGNDFESRYIQIDYTQNGVPLVVNSTYRICPFIPLGITEQDVRKVIGLSYDELKDSDIDIHASYFYLKNTFGDDLLVALTAANIAALSAQEAIALQAAIDTYPSWQIRVLSDEKQDTASYTRNDTDFVKLLQDLNDRLAIKLALIHDTLHPGNTDGVTPVYFALGTPIDPVTNT